MDNNEVNNISALFKKPVIANPSFDIKKPVKPSRPASTLPVTNRAFSPKSVPSEAKSQTSNLVKKDFSLVDFSKNKTIKDDSIYKSDFRNKTRGALKGTLNRSKDRNTVANILWDRRGNGLNSGEVKNELRKAEQKGTLRPDQVRAVRRKMGI